MSRLQIIVSIPESYLDKFNNMISNINILNNVDGKFIVEKIDKIVAEPRRSGDK